jgi:hypothetical protein
LMEWIMPKLAANPSRAKARSARKVRVPEQRVRRPDGQMVRLVTVDSSQQDIR